MKDNDTNDNEDNEDNENKDNELELFIENLDFDKIEKSTTKQSYYEKNKEKLREYHKNYYRKKKANELKNKVVIETIRDEPNKYHESKIYKLTHLDKMIYRFNNSFIRNDIKFS